MSLQGLIKDINKKYGFKLITKGEIEPDVGKVPFSSLRLNYMLYGGLPLGRIVEFFGAEGSGKTTTALDAVKNYQKMFPDRYVMYVDCERTFDAKWAKTLGVDIDNLIFVSPEEQTAEEIFEIIYNTMETGEISLAVLDSLAAMVSAQAYDKTMEEKTYGGISQSLTLFSRKLIPVLAKYNATFIGINQLRDNMNSTYGGTITTGGRAWKHNCTTRIEFKKGDYFDFKGNRVNQTFENPAGNIVNCNIAKNKAGRPDRKTGYYTLNYLDGIDYYSDAIDLAVKYGLITVAGAWYKIEDEEITNQPLKFQGKNAVKNALKEDENLFKNLTDFLQKELA